MTIRTDFKGIVDILVGLLISFNAESKTTRFMPLTNLYVKCVGVNYLTSSQKLLAKSHCYAEPKVAKKSASNTCKVHYLTLVLFVGGETRLQVC